MPLIFWFDHSLGARAKLSNFFVGKNIYSEIIWPLKISFIARNWRNLLKTKFLPFTPHFHEIKRKKFMLRIDCANIWTTFGTWLARRALMFTYVLITCFHESWSLLFVKINLFVTSKNENTNFPIHEFKMLHKG